MSQMSGLRPKGALFLDIRYIHVKGQGFQKLSYMKGQRNLEFRKSNINMNYLLFCLTFSCNIIHYKRFRQRMQCSQVQCMSVKSINRYQVHRRSTCQNGLQRLRGWTGASPCKTALLKINKIKIYKPSQSYSSFTCSKVEPTLCSIISPTT